MAVRTRIEPLERDIQLILDEELSPAARSAAFAAFAQDAIDGQGRRQARHRPKYGVRRWAQSRRYRRSSPTGLLSPSSIFGCHPADCRHDLQEFAGAPASTGANLIFVDGTEFRWATSRRRRSEVTFMNVTPYAQRIERGWSPKAPDGVYQATATWAKKLQIARSIRIRTVDGLRNPAIVMRATDAAPGG
jgi:hypothetical protein